MNSINVGAASAGSNLGLFKHYRGLSSSRHSVARSTYSGSSTNMAAAIVAGNQGKMPGGDAPEDHHHKVPKVNDPVVLRTCTVDEAFRRMEELVGSEEEEKNWKGIVIALAVIGFILGMIALAIVLISPDVEKYDPGLPFEFSTLSNKKLLLKQPVLSWVKGVDQYVVYVQRDLNSTDHFVERHVSLVSPGIVNDTTSILVPQDIISTGMQDIEVVHASPTTEYALLRLDSESDSIVTKSTYIIYEHNESRIIELPGGGKKLQYADWIGDSNELVYIETNTIYYKKSPLDKNPIQVSSNGSASVLHGVADKTYKVYVLPKRESLIWPSPVDSKFVYATVLKQKEDKPSYTTLHVFDGSSSQDLNLTSIDGYVTSVVWMDSKQILIVWLSFDHQTEQYVICDSTTGACRLNYEYNASDLNLKWVGLYGTPVYNKKLNEYYTLLPDPANEKFMHRHIAAIKVNPSERRDPDVTFLTDHPWSDTEILGFNGTHLYFLGTGLNYTHQLLYSLNVTSGQQRCLTCKTFTGVNDKMTYVEAQFSSSYSHVYLSILGPGIPTFHIISTQSLYSEQVTSTQIDQEHYEGLKSTYEHVYLPKVEYLTVPLDDGMEASVKLLLPSMFNRKKICLYETILIVNSIPGTRIATQKFSLGFNEYLAKNQTYILALADVRGSGGRGEKIRQSISGKLGTAEGYDVAKIISFLAKNNETYKVDGDYVAVMGKDYGGFISLHAAAHQAFKCGIVSSPITSVAKYGSWLVDRYMDNNTMATELNYACTETSETCSVPHTSSVLLVHGTSDAVVGVENSLELMRHLQMADYTFRQQIYPDIGNNLESTDISTHYYQTINNYLSECFQIKERADNSQINFCGHRSS